MGGRSRIIIADNQTILREGLKALLHTASDMEIVGEASDGYEAVAACRDTAPDILLLELSLPRMTGLEALRRIKREVVETKVIILTAHHTEAHLIAALREGADGYVLKGAFAGELKWAIRSVMDGDRYLCPRISATVIAGYLARVGSSATRSVYGHLSNRECEVLKLIAEGRRNREVAELLFISAKTVEKHRSNVMRKLALHNLPALVAFAMETGLISGKPLPALSPGREVESSMRPQ